MPLFAVIFVVSAFIGLFNCEGDLCLSEGQASRRVSAARLVESRPEVGEKIASGKMSLGVAAELARFFKNEKLDEEKKMNL